MLFTDLTGLLKKVPENKTDTQSAKNKTDRQSAKNKTGRVTGTRQSDKHKTDTQTE